MEINKLRSLLEATLSKMEADLERYALLFCADRGYRLEEATLFFDDSALAPGIRVSLTPSLRYDAQELRILAAALEDDLTNIAFHYAYNRRHEIGAEDSNLMRPALCNGEHIAPCPLALQN